MTQMDQNKLPSFIMIFLKKLKMKTPLSFWNEFLVGEKKVLSKPRQNLLSH